MPKKLELNLSRVTDEPRAGFDFTGGLDDEIAITERTASRDAQALEDMVKLLDYEAEAVTKGVWLDSIRWTSIDEDGQEAPLEHLPRRDPGPIAELKDSIRQREAETSKGLIQPIEVRPTGEYICMGYEPQKGSRCGKILEASTDECPEHPGAVPTALLEGVSGLRRYTAYREMSKTTPKFARIPATLVRANTEELCLRALTENLERRPLDPFEQGEFMLRMMKLFGWTQDDLARRLGKSKPTVSKLIRPAKNLSVEVKRDLRRLGADRETAALVAQQSDEKSQRSMVKRIARLRKEGQPVRKAARLARAEAESAESFVPRHTHRVVLASKRLPGVEVRYTARDRSVSKPSKKDVLRALDVLHEALRTGNLDSAVEWEE